MGALAALLVLSGGIWWGHLSVNALAATVLVTPNSMHLQQTLEVVVASQPNPNGDIAGHALTATSPTLTQTGRATGKEPIQATAAEGLIVVSDLTLNPSGTVRVYSSFTSSSGVAISTDFFDATSEPGSFLIPAHAGQAGARGNIPAYDIDFTVVLLSAADGSPVGHAHAYNPRPFIEGADAHEVTVVQQSDIDGLAQPVMAELTPSTREALNEQVAQHQQPGEQTALPAPECTPTIQSDRQVGAEVAKLTVQVAVTCYQILYAERDLLPGVIHAQERQASSRFTEGFRLIGQMQASAPVFFASDPIQRLAFLRVNADSIWAYHLDGAVGARMAERIAGETTEEAETLLLDQYAGRLADVTFELAGFGGKLPTETGAIRMVAQEIAGLHP
jgi:hypothetical protein